MKKLGLRSFVLAPLMSKENVIGALAFHYRSRAISFTGAQVDFTGKVAASLSLALENARLYTAEHRIAETLQEALLTMPKRLTGLNFGHLYESATVEAAKVGGDFYDIFELDNDRVGLIIGDVSGKGLAAATVTALIKNTIRAYAFQEESPANVMEKTNSAIRNTLDSTAFVTAFFAVLNKRSGLLVYVNAGHPPPILLRRTIATPLQVDAMPPIGIFDDLGFFDQQEVLRKGDTLIAYTDGVTEARQNKGLFGEGRLIKLVKTLRDTPAADIPRAMIDNILEYSGGHLSDDVAILAVELKEKSRR